MKLPRGGINGGCNANTREVFEIGAQFIRDFRVFFQPEAWIERLTSINSGVIIKDREIDPLFTRREFYGIDIQRIHCRLFLSWHEFAKIPHAVAQESADGIGSLVHMPTDLVDRHPLAVF